MANKAAVRAQTSLFDAVVKTLKDEGEVTLNIAEVGDSKEGTVALLKSALQYVYRVPFDEAQVIIIETDEGVVGYVEAPNK